MPVDPQIQALLDQRDWRAGDAYACRSPKRGGSTRRASPSWRRRPRWRRSRSARIDGPRGPIELRIYTPAGSGPFPLMVFFHGSGFVLCSLDTHDGMCRNLAAGIGCVVVSVDYRLAPRAQVSRRAGRLPARRPAGRRRMRPNCRADPARIMLAGDSAGGNMAAVTALRVRDEGGPALSGQMLLYPVTDYHTPGTPSYVENADGYGLTRDTMEWFWAHYLNDAAEADHPHASPLRAPDLGGPPPAYVVSAEYDPLRDEAERYGERLARRRRAPPRSAAGRA